MHRRIPAFLAAAALLATPALAQAPEELQREIERLRAELVKLGASEHAGESEAAARRAQLRALNAQETALRDRIDANRGELARLLGALQMYQRRPPPPLLVNPRSARDAVRAAILIRAVTPELQARGRAFAVQAEAINRVRRTAATASETLFQAESDIADRRGDIERLVAEKNALERRLYRDAGEADPETRAMAARAGSVEALVQGLAARQAAPLPTRLPDRFIPPVLGPVERRFGQANAGGERAQGWTWRAEPEAPVLAPAAGRVDYAGPLKNWGLVLILNVGDGHRLVLAGLAEATVGVGRPVAAGEPVGRMGRASDKDPPPELDLELRSAATAVDPARFLTAAAAGPAPMRR
jgi:septal ring factor EnvC (AmiA/AmiB activator)